MADDSLQFRFTTASRAEKSCHHFAKGVWGNAEEDTIVYPIPIENDPLIRVCLIKMQPLYLVFSTLD